MTARERDPQDASGPTGGDVERVVRPVVNVALLQIADDLENWAGLMGEQDCKDLAAKAKAAGTNEWAALIEKALWLADSVAGYYNDGTIDLKRLQELAHAMDDLRDHEKATPPAAPEPGR